MSTHTLDFGDIVSEAAENAGLDPSALNHRHLASISRSFQLLMIELETEGATAEYRIETKSYAMNPNDGGIILDSDTIDVTQATLSINNQPVPLGRTSREDFLNLSFPSQQGNPSIYFVMKSDLTGDFALPANVLLPPATTGTPILVVWPQNGLSNTLGPIAINVVRFRQHRLPTGLGDTPDTRRNWLPTICMGLSAKIALKYNPQIEPNLTAKYDALLKGNAGDEDHHPVTIGYRGYGWGRHRRH